MSTRYVDYWEDLNEMPEDGPFVVCGGPVGANVPRLEHARGPDGVGCPVGLHREIYELMEARQIPRGSEGASRLNELYREGAFYWDGRTLRPKEPV